MSISSFFVRMSFLAAFSSYISALAPKFCTKNAGVNVDKIDTRVTSRKGWKRAKVESQGVVRH